MKAAPFDYVAPTSMSEACELLSEAGGGAQILAGGQTLMPLLALRMSQPFIMIDLNRIDALKGVSETSEGLRIGAMTRQADLMTDKLIASKMPLLAEAASWVGHMQTRARGTIGGSIALGEPAAELPATALALGAQIEVQSASGTRQIAAEDFYFGPYMTALEPDEIVTAIIFPNWAARSISIFREVQQRPGDFALVGLVGMIAIESDVISKAGLAWFGMGPTPIRAKQAEAALIGKSPALADMDEIATLAIADTAPFDDHHASAEYRRTVGRRIFAKTLKEALNVRQAA